MLSNTKLAFVPPLVLASKSTDDEPIKYGFVANSESIFSRPDPSLLAATLALVCELISKSSLVLIVSVSKDVIVVGLTILDPDPNFVTVNDSLFNM